MGAVCSSSKNKKPYDNLDLAHIKDEPTKKALFSQESGHLLDEIHELTQISIVKFNKIIFAKKRIKATKNEQLKEWSKNIKLAPTPNRYKTTEFVQEMNEKLSNKSLIELCDLSRHFMKLCTRNIRVINLTEEIQRHFGSNDVRILHSTIEILHDIGYRAPEPEQTTMKGPIFMIIYDDLQYVKEIKWYLELHILSRRPPQEMKVEDYSADVEKWYFSLFDSNKNERDKLCLNEDGKYLLNEIDNLHFDNLQSSHVYIDRFELLICGYLKNVILEFDFLKMPKIIFTKCRLYFHPSMASHKNFSFLSHLSQMNDSFNLCVYDMINAKKHNVNITNIENNAKINHKESILMTVQNASIPTWIQMQFENELKNESISISQNDSNLSLLFVKSVEYDNTLIIIDSLFENGFNFAIPSGTDIVSRMYGLSQNNILCIDDENEFMDYNIEFDQYHRFKMDKSAYFGSIPSGSIQDSVGCGVCTFDYGKKMFLCGGMDIKQSERGRYKYFNNANVIELDHQTFRGKYVKNISAMHLSKAYFDCLYVNELQIIIAGAGGQKREISSNVIEIFDLNKNRWNVISAKTNYCYESIKDVKRHKNMKKSILWTDVNNPFVVNMCNGTDFCEFIDLRICKEWIANDHINGFLHEMKGSKKGMNGQLLI